jgi:hypothetical protein
VLRRAGIEVVSAHDLAVEAASREADLDGYRSALAAGVFESPEEVGRIFKLTAEEVAALQPTAQTEVASHADERASP